MTYLKSQMIGFNTLFLKETTRVFRIWSQTLLPSVVTSTIYFIIFGYLLGERVGGVGGHSYIQFISPGLIMMSIITNSYGNVVASFFISKFQRSIEEILVSPMSNFTIILGYISGGVLRGMLVGILVAMVSYCFTKTLPDHLVLTLILGLIISALFSLAGLINAIFARNFDDINIVPVYILTPLTYLGGVFYSVELLPEYWRWMMYINPIFYKISAFRYAMLGISEVQFALAVTIMVSLVLVLYGVSIALLRKGVGLKT